MARIVCVGLACLDYLFKTRTLPRGGGKFFAQNYVAAPGGPAAVASLAVASLGHEAVFLGCLGDDAIGDEVIRRLEERGVEAGMVRCIKNQTSQVSSVVVDDAGERQVVNFSSSRLDSDPAWLPREVIATAEFVLTDVRWPEGAAMALEIALEHGVPSLLDADISPIDIRPLVRQARYSVFSEGGLEMITGLRDPERGLQQVERDGGACVAVTMGEKGSYWLENGKIGHCPAEPIEAVDTCGAGDVFHGAFAVGMVEKMGVVGAMRFAGAAATLKCMTFGGSMGVPQREAVDKLLAGQQRL